MPNAIIRGSGRTNLGVNPPTGGRRLSSPNPSANLAGVEGISTQSIMDVPWVVFPCSFLRRSRFGCDVFYSTICERRSLYGTCDFSRHHNHTRIPFRHAVGGIIFHQAGQNFE